MPLSAQAELAEPYEQVATLLKDSPEVHQLVSLIHYVAEDDLAKPFIVLEACSGVGKTQMAFNLMARRDIDVLVACTTH